MFDIVSEGKEPDWSVELVKGGEALLREVQPIVRAFDQFLCDARLAKASGGPALPLVQRVALIADARLRELRSPNATVTAAPATAVAMVPAPTVVTFSGSVALAPFRVAGEVTVEERRSPIDGHLLVMVILWLLVLVGPEAIMKANLSSGATTILDAYYGAIAAIAVAVTVDYHQKRNR